MFHSTLCDPCPSGALKKEKPGGPQNVLDGTFENEKIRR